HNPSFAMRLPVVFWCVQLPAIYHTTPRNGKLRCAELPAACMRALRTVLVTALAFPHHAAQEEIEYALSRPNRPGREGMRRDKRIRQEERRGGKREHCRRDGGKNLCRPC